MKHIRLIIILLSIFGSSFGQNKSRFHTVNLPDSIIVSLKNFLTKKEKLSITGAILTYNLLDKKNYMYEDGIYSFKLLGSHFHRNIFIVHRKNIYIFKGYYLNELLPEFYLFLNQKKLTSKTEIDYLKAISLFLEEEYISENS